MLLKKFHVRVISNVGDKIYLLLANFHVVSIYINCFRIG